MRDLVVSFEKLLSFSVAGALSHKTYNKSCVSFHGLDISHP